jgi:DNA-binding response OmpR family regulator
MTDTWCHVVYIDSDEDESMEVANALEVKGWECEPYPDLGIAVERMVERRPQAVILRAGREFMEGNSMAIHKELVTRMRGLPPLVLLTTRTADAERAAWQGAKLAGIASYGGGDDAFPTGMDALDQLLRGLKLK